MKRSLLVALVLSLALPALAQARDFTVRSFDGTEIAAHLFPAEGIGPGERLPTVLVGPGWSSPGDTDPNAETSDAVGSVGLGPLRRAGYNVVTWDPRGFGDSGGEAQVDSPDFEARDVQALLDHLAQQPEAQLDAPGDPRVGMAGASYGGGIQFVSAAIDGRIDAIAPAIAWHSLLTSLNKDSTLKTGWGTALCGLGGARGVADGLVGPGLQTGSLDPHVWDTCVNGLATGEMSKENRDWFAARGPGQEYIGRIRVPTLILQGTVDTLFTLEEAIANYRILRANGVPTSMLWFCGGHGVCLTGSGSAGHVEEAILRWFARHLKEDTSVDTGSRFEWIDQNGTWRQASDYPLEPAGELAATGAGRLTFTPADTAQSGIAVAATPAANAVTVDLPAPAAEGDLIGTPELKLDYNGLASAQSVRLFAQVVDLERGVVAGNQATPIPLTLDGKQRTLTRSLEAIAQRVTPGSRYQLQITPASTLYTQQRAGGSVDLSRISISLPLVQEPRAACVAPRFAPASATVRRGRVALRPSVRCAGKALAVPVRITGGTRAWRGLAGRRATIRVPASRRALIARFAVDGRSFRRVIRLKRR